MAKTSSSSTQGSSIGPQSLDMLGSRFSLGFPTLTGKFQTSFGGYLTLLMGIFSGAAFIVIFSQFFETDTPMVTSSLEFGSKIVKANLFEEEIFYPMVLANDEDGFMSQKFDKYFTPKIIMTVFDRSGRRITRMVDYVRCSDIQDPEILEKFKRILPEERFLPRAICPDFRGIKEDFFVKTDPINFSFNEILLHIYPCSLPDPTQCATKDQVNGANLIMYRLDKFVVSTDKENPLRENYDRNGMRFDTFNVKYKYMDVKKNMVIDDTSIYGNPHTKLEYATATQASMDNRSRDPNSLHCTKTEVESGQHNACAEYFLISFRAVSYMMVVRRNYKKLTTILGEFGGVLKLVTTAVMLFYSIYSSRKMKGFFTKHLFNLSEKNSKNFNDLLKQADLRKKRKRMRGQNSGETLAKNPGQNSEIIGVKQPSPKPVREMKEIMKICVAKNLTATDILSKLQFVEALQKTFFTEDERTLLPLAILGMNEEELEETEEASKKGQRLSQGPQQNINKNRGKTTIENKTGLDGNRTPQTPSSQNIYKQAYQRMTSEEKDEEEEGHKFKGRSKPYKSIRQFILKNTQKFFQEEAKSAKNPDQLNRRQNKEKEFASSRNIINRVNPEEGESSERYINFFAKKNKVAPSQKKSSFSTNSTGQFQDLKGEMSPLKISMACREWERSDKRLVRSPLKKKESRKKSKLFFKMEETQLRESVKDSKERSLASAKDHQGVEILASPEMKDPEMIPVSTPRPHQEVREDQE